MLKTKSGNALGRFHWEWFGSLQFPRTRFSFLPQLIRLFSRSDATAETLLHQKIADLRANSDLSESESRWLERLKDLAELRGLLFGQPLHGKKALRQAFAYRPSSAMTPRQKNLFDSETNIGLQDILESATIVSDLYWKLYDTAAGSFPDLTELAQGLYHEIFGRPFHQQSWRAEATHLVNLIQNESGLPYLVLNLIHQGDIESCRSLTAHLLTEDRDIDEEVRSALYWVSELHWFTQKRKEPIADFDSTIRYLYHLCFTKPDRAGFLEIDSQFFSEFETVNELAKEGFLFKEMLFEKILSLWKQYEGCFDTYFQQILESMTQTKSKIYDDREHWEHFWAKEKINFSRDHLYVVEGNLFYASGHFEEARSCYTKAIKLNPELRPALLNLLFCHAQLNDWKSHKTIVDKILSQRSLSPSNLSVIGNSFLLLKDEESAEAYYQELKQIKGWERKTSYYKSTFCFEHGIHDLALKYAKAAYEESPNDASVRYHLSLCFNAVGEKLHALQMLEELEASPDLMWLNYYRFTLERDLRKHDAATKTLMNIPLDYFQEPEELSAALEFAKSQKDFVLLRHLKFRKS